MPLPQLFTVTRPPVTVTSPESSVASDDHHHLRVSQSITTPLLHPHDPWLWLPGLRVSKHVREMRIPVCFFILLWCAPVFGFFDFWRPSSWLRLWKRDDNYAQQENGLGVNTGEEIIQKFWFKQRGISFKNKDFRVKTNYCNKIT